jgi:hypothetical protein
MMFRDAKEYTGIYGRKRARKRLFVRWRNFRWDCNCGCVTVRDNTSIKVTLHTVQSVHKAASTGNVK